MFDTIREKHIFIIPILITALSILILYRFFYLNFLEIYYISENFFLTHKLFIPDGFDLKYLVLFTGLALMSFTDMLFEKILDIIPELLMLAGLIFAYTSNTPLISVLEASLIGLGIFILIDITRLDSYAFGDILTAGAVGIYVGIENIIIISILSIILGKVITYIAFKLDSICDKSSVKEFHMAFVPVLFLITTIVCVRLK